ncbi:MAG: penicillin-insensitive murein endopeptidase, partial [Myxococcales bacterium]|nr:penicillin-insensitive murein endopeptidase [Myxococcales bacterium]
MRGRHTTERARGHRFLEASGLQRLAKGALSVGLLATALAIAGCASHTLPSSPGNGAPDNDPASLATEEAVSASPAHPVVPSVSLGRPNAGALEVGVEMPEDPRWEIVVPQHAWGTQETVDGIAAAVAAVNREHPGAHPLHIGDLSREFGGPLYPHRSHQSGRDVDLG